MMMIDKIRTIKHFLFQFDVALISLIQQILDLEQVNIPKLL